MNGHEFLPWYLNETLDPRETEAFEAHLSGCPACRRELEAIRSFREALGPQGLADLLAEHPDPREILACASPTEADVEISRTRATEVRRHVALCVACGQESAWLQGRAVATAPSPPSGRLWLAAAAAALLIFGVALGFVWRAARTGGVPGGSGLTRLVLVSSTQRATGAEQVIAAPSSDADRLTLLFEVDLPPEDLPASIELRTASGRLVRPPQPISAADLFRGAYAALACRPSDCPPGGYVVTVRPRTEARGPLIYRFRLAAPATPS